MVSRPLEQGQGIRNFADFPRVAPGRSPRKLLLFRCRGSHIPQRPMVVGEVAGIENLGTGVMLAIEGSRVGRASRVSGSLRRIEPNAEMVHLYRIEGRVH